MRAWKAWLVVGALLSGSALSLVVATQAGTGFASSAAPPLVEVPRGRAGDRVVYDETWNETIAGDDARDTHGVRRSAFEISAENGVPDRTGAGHQVARLSWGAPDAGDAREGAFPHANDVAVDLDTRQLVACSSSFDVPAYRPASAFPRFSIHGAAPALACYQPWRDLLLVVAQGRRLSLNATLDDSWASARQADQRTFEVLGGGYFFYGVPTFFDGDLKVDRVALVDGVLAYGLHARVSFGTHRFVEVAGTAGPTSTTLDARRETHEWNESSDVTVWWTSRSAYPARVDAHFLVHERDLDDGRELRTIEASSVLTLVEVAPGTQPLAWALTPQPAEYRDRDPAPERSSPTSVWPQDGSGSKLAPPLSVALDRAQNDPTLRDFAAWRTRNPAYVLAGGEYFEPRARGAAGPLETPVLPVAPDPTPEWRLVFAAPGGTSGFDVELRSAADRPDAPLVARELGEHALAQRERFAPSDLPAAPLTMAAIERAFELHRVRATDELVYIGWGMGTRTHAGLSVREWMSLATLASGVTEVSATGTPRGRDIEGVFLDLTSGNITQLQDFDIKWDSVDARAIAADLPVAQSSVDELRPAREANIAPLATTLTLGLLFVALLTYFLPLLRFGATSLFSRLRPSTVLDNATRDALTQRIRAEPGITPPELQAAVGAGWTTTVYHLDVLERNGLVRSIIDGRHKRFFAVGLVDARDIPKLAVLRNARTRQIHSLLASRPGITQRDIAFAVDIAPPSVAWHLRRLEHAGLLARERRGREVALLPR